VGWHVYPQTVVSMRYDYKIPTKCVGLEQSGPHHHWKLSCSRHDISEKWVGVKQQSLTCSISF
jgi:hypothetical protein